MNKQKYPEWPKHTNEYQLSVAELNQEIKRISKKGIKLENSFIDFNSELKALEKYFTEANLW
mgnify:CR=1 FL=1